MNNEKILAESLEKLLVRKNLDDIQVSEIVSGLNPPVKFPMVNVHKLRELKDSKKKNEEECMAW